MTPGRTPASLAGPARPEQCAGVLLAGGASSRFGSNKALALFRGRPVIAHVASTLQATFTNCLLVTNTPETYEFLGLPMIGDRWPGAGPLAGIQAALRHLREQYCFVAACDLPLLDRTCIRFLCSLRAGYDAVAPRLSAGFEPLHAVYGKSCLPVIEERLARRQFRIDPIFARLRARIVDEQEILAVVADLSSFHNVNRPEDLEGL